MGPKGAFNLLWRVEKYVTLGLHTHSLSLLLSLSSQSLVWSVNLFILTFSFILQQ